ncbi:Zn-dependent hydrolase [Alkalihalobacillus sp. 1P02AB]|uniref:Zn-dependent hydrolase n=1 Tax=Alkalihalobacillus sp. 1P02AB TaxID=3132260 RepID=UPI0039A482AC
MIASMQINKKRLWETIERLNQIGKDPLYPDKGNTRLSLSKEDLLARELLIKLMKEVGLSVKVDAVGNIIGRLEGANPKAPVVMTGSHIDTVYQGGKFDGTLGVLGAIEAVRRLKELEIQLEHPIEVVSFTDEEGTRFGTGYIGSRAMAGELKLPTLELKDDSGITLFEALKTAGLEPEKFKECIREKKELKAFIEMHIEQGKVLEENHLAVGVVTHIQGPVWLQVELVGSTDHAGATPMHMRKDASLAMAEMMLAVEQMAIKYDGVGTVGKLHIEPGGVNIIPGRAEFSVDMRHVDYKKRAEMIEELHLLFKEISERRGVLVKVEVNKEVDPATCSPALVQSIVDTCGELKIPTMTLPCGAGHDSLMMTKITEMAMIFVRSKGGISHNPLEWSSIEDCTTGTEVLFQTLYKLAK